jgi:hypothetical protein
MNLNLFVIGFDHMPKNVAAKFICPFSITKPFIAILRFALDHAFGVVDATICAGMCWQTAEVKWLDLLHRCCFTFSVHVALGLRWRIRLILRSKCLLSILLIIWVLHHSPICPLIQILFINPSTIISILKTAIRIFITIVAALLPVFLPIVLRVVLAALIFKSVLLVATTSTELVIHYFESFLFLKLNYLY